MQISYSEWYALIRCMDCCFLHTVCTVDLFPSLIVFTPFLVILSIHSHYHFPAKFFCKILQKSLSFWQTLFHKVRSDIVRSVYPDIYRFIFLIHVECVCQNRTFYENNMILWYHQILPKVVSKVLHGLMDTITRTKTKHITITKKIRGRYFSVQSIITQNMRFPHPVIAAILDVILNISQNLK